ncbi:hypothetical protein [Thiohalocapsa sp.]|uniref:hypothetical protein n=1 Tax=Thiohalocapsa sp. TaxID=2497641 RepID=UPI0025EA3E92|nr:hypothetical protein [Thiohalocapsa sp.]
MLFQDAELKAAERWARDHASEVGAIERDYLVAARSKQRGRQRFRWLANMALVLASVALVLLFWALETRQQAEQEATRADNARATAVAEADRARAAEANQADLHNRHGDTHYKQEDYDAAIAEYNEAINL